MRLVVVRGYDAQEVVEPALVAEILARRRVTDLGDLEQLEEVLHLQCDAAGAWTDDSHQGRSSSLLTGYCPTVIYLDTDDTIQRVSTEEYDWVHYRNKAFLD